MRKGKLNLDDSMLRMLVINDRAGLYGRMSHATVR